MRFQSLDAWLQWQSRLHSCEIELGLERVAKVWRLLHQGRLPFKVITIAGTNGKGSSAAFLEAILLAAGYRIGCFTSPHLIHYNERIRVNGEEVNDETICRAFERIDQARGEATLTFFEFGALAALEVFTSQPLDAVILEVGLGGRLDAINIVDPDVALITSIGIDHTEWLGQTLDEIAWEKAGIMRGGRPAVFAGREAPEALLRAAQEKEVSIRLAGRDFGYQLLGLELGGCIPPGTADAPSEGGISAAQRLCCTDGADPVAGGASGRSRCHPTGAAGGAGKRAFPGDRRGPCHYPRCRS